MIVETGTTHLPWYLSTSLELKDYTLKFGNLGLKVLSYMQHKKTYFDKHIF